MHQSGHWRAHSMQTVQFSSLSAMTPRARAGGSSRSCGYCTVTAGLSIVLNVMPRPPIRPGSFGFFIRTRPSSLAHSLRAGIPGSLPLVPVASQCDLEDAGEEDVEETDGDQVLPRDRLQLVFAQAGIRESHPEHEKGDGHDLGEEHGRPEE